jgi:hypothetical protein
MSFAIIYTLLCIAFYVAAFFDYRSSAEMTRVGIRESNRLFRNEQGFFSPRKYLAFHAAAVAAFVVGYFVFSRLSPEIPFYFFLPIYGAISKTIAARHNRRLISQQSTVISQQKAAAAVNC